MASWRKARASEPPVLNNVVARHLANGQESIHEVTTVADFDHRRDRALILEVGQQIGREDIAHLAASLRGDEELDDVPAVPFSPHFAHTVEVQGQILIIIGGYGALQRAKHAGGVKAPPA